MVTAKIAHLILPFYSDIKGDYWIFDQIVFLEHVSDNSDQSPRVLLTGKNMNANWEIAVGTPEVTFELA